MRACHRDHVQDTLTERMARGSDIDDARGVKDWQRHGLLHARDLRQEGRQRLGHAGHVFFGEV